MREQLVKLSKTYTDNYTEASDKFLDAVVENNKKAVDFAFKTADQVVEQLPELPWADRVPTAAEFGERYIDFVERAVEVQREFTERVVKSLQTDVIEVAEPTPAPAKKAPAKKRATKKATAKKASTATKATAKAAPSE